MQQLKGIIPPMVTPLTDQETLDTSGLERLIEHILDGGVNGLFVLGSSGEAASLPESLQKQLIARTIGQVAGRVPVLVGITDTCLRDCLARANYAADHGASAVVLSAPYYFPIGQKELLSFTEKAVNACPLPAFIYNMPDYTTVAYEIDTLKRLAEHPNIHGIKDSSGDMQYFHRLIDLASGRPDWSVLIGPEELLAEAIMMGGHGGVCGGANIFPRLYQLLYEAVCRKNMDDVQQLHRLVMVISKSIYNGNFLPSVKCALECLAICSGCIAEPLHCPSPKHQKEIADFLETFEDIKSPQKSILNKRKIMSR